MVAERMACVDSFARATYTSHPSGA